MRRSRAWFIAIGVGVLAVGGAVTLRVVGPRATSGIVRSLELPAYVATFRTTERGNRLGFLGDRFVVERYATSPKSVADTCSDLRSWFAKRGLLQAGEGAVTVVSGAPRCTFSVHRKGVRVVVSVFSTSPLTGRDIPAAAAYVYVYNGA